MDIQSGWDAIIPPKFAVILTGGKSRRFGADKAWAKLSGKSLIYRLAEMLEDAGFKIVISTNTPEKYNAMAYDVVQDRTPYQGPLGAIWSVLSTRAIAKILVVACDMPLLPKEVALKLWQLSHHHDLAVLRGVHGELNPLPGVYSQELLSHIAILQSKGRRDLKALFTSGCDVISLPWPLWSHDDATQSSWVNINTPQDLKEIST